MSTLITEERAGQRLDIVVSEALRCSRTTAKKLIQKSSVLVNSLAETHPNYLVKAADEITVDEAKADLISFTGNPEQIISPENIPLKILFEDKNLLVIDKPIDLVVHPAAGHHNDTLANAVKYYLQQKGEDNFPQDKAGLVHRLDGPTSGVIVVAKNPEALDFLSDQFAQREVKKFYLALVSGNFPLVAVSDSAIGRDRFSRQKFSSKLGNSRLRDAKTEFELLITTENKAYSLVLAKPFTGRTHQIRVHLSEMGYPIVGDTTYRGESAPRLFLHAFALNLRPNPESNEAVLFTSPLPENFVDGLLAKGLQVDILKNALEEKLRAI